MAWSITNNRRAAERVRELGNKTADYPRKGVHVGAGIHVPMPNAWDGVGPVPPGWSSAVELLLHPQRAEFAVRLPADTSGDAKLTAPEKTELDAARATAAADLPADWEGARSGASAAKE